jgi:hypothetical protein
METAIQTFTENSLESIINMAGDYYWTLGIDRAKNSKYLVCSSSVGVNRGSGFLVGKISDFELVKYDPDKKERYIIHISEWASIDIPKLWPGNQNPIRYTSLEDLGINVSDLKFEKISKVSTSPSQSLTIAEAKIGLAKYYEVNPDNIEITIKG